MRLTHRALFALPLATLIACGDSIDDDSEPSGVDAELAAELEAARRRPAMPPAAQQELQATLDALVAAGVAPGVGVAVRHPAYRPFAASAGVADVHSGAPLTAAHQLRAGSMLKTAVAAATLQLVERKKLSLDAPLTSVLEPRVTSQVAEAEHITVRMLLSHTSGVPELTDGDFDQRVVDDPTHVWRLDELLARSAAEPRPFAPGAGWAYSNTNYILLGEVIEEVTGKPWRKIVEERVLARAGLQHSELPRPGDPRCAGCSRGYEVLGDELRDITEVDPSMAGPAGGAALVTTTEDLAQLLAALETGRLFEKPATLELMHGFVAAPLPEEAQAGYGLGLARFELGDVVLHGHLGGTAGYQGFMLRDTASGLTVTGFLNRHPGGLGDLILPVLDAVSRIQ